MATYSTSEMKAGLKVMVDGEPCNILENEGVKPGKGQAFNRVKIKFLRTGRVLEKTYRSGDSLESADVVDCDMQYLYSDGGRTPSRRAISEMPRAFTPPVVMISTAMSRISSIVSCRRRARRSVPVLVTSSPR